MRFMGLGRSYIKLLLIIEKSMKVYRRYISKEKQEKALEEVKVNFHGSYGALLFDSRWKDKRNIILARDNEQCVICGLSDELQVHHRQYHYVTTLKKFQPPWQYPDNMLITLCNSCHQRGHSKYKVPIIYI